MKKGRFSKEEQQFIEQNCEPMPLEKIAEALDRDASSVDNFIKPKLGKGISKQEEVLRNAEYDLKSRPYWKDLSSQFNDEELEMFLFHWTEMISQFKDDVFHTEEMQVVDVIKLDILMNRTLKEQQKSMNDIGDMEMLILTEKQKGRDERDRDYILNMERQIAVLRAAQESLGKDYKEMQAKKNTMLKELKGTREQRIKILEDSKETFAAWVRALIQDKGMRKEIGANMEKMRLAMEKEKVRLSEFHKYEDGLIDQPFLTPETVEDD